MAAVNTFAPVARCSPWPLHPVYQSKIKALKRPIQPKTIWDEVCQAESEPQGPSSETIVSAFNRRVNTYNSSSDQCFMCLCESGPIFDAIALVASLPKLNWLRSTVLE